VGPGPRGKCVKTNDSRRKKRGAIGKECSVARGVWRKQGNYIGWGKWKNIRKKSTHKLSEKGTS